MSYISLLLTNSLNDHAVERRYTTDTLVSVLKSKLELITGIMVSDMRLDLYQRPQTAASEKFICSLEDNDRPLAAYPCSGEGLRLNVVDIHHSANGDGAADGDAGVKKFEISQEDYDKRDGTVRAFKKANKIGEFDEQKKKELEDRERAEKELGDSIKVGDRCESRVEGQPARRGAVAFVGVVDFKPGQVWVGIHYDEPVGKNNGTVSGKSYFTCPDKYGGFVRPSSVTTGDFPPLDDLELDEF